MVKFRVVKRTSVLIFNVDCWIAAVVIKRELIAQGWGVSTEEF